MELSMRDYSETVETTSTNAEADCFDNSDEEMPGDDTTVGSVYESIETNLWLAEAYFARGSEGIGVECLRGAWMEYVRFRDILWVYSGEELGERLVRALVTRAGDAAAALALGSDPGADRLRTALAAA
jgi:hypothetical protein